MRRILSGNEVEHVVQLLSGFVDVSWYPAVTSLCLETPKVRLDEAVSVPVQSRGVGRDGL